MKTGRTQIWDLLTRDAGALLAMPLWLSGLLTYISIRGHLGAVDNTTLVSAKWVGEEIVELHQIVSCWFVVCFFLISLNSTIYGFYFSKSFPCLVTAIFRNQSHFSFWGSWFLIHLGPHTLAGIHSHTQAMLQMLLRKLDVWSAKHIFPI